MSLRSRLLPDDVVSSLRRRPFRAPAAAGVAAFGIAGTVHSFAPLSLAALGVATGGSVAVVAAAAALVRLLPAPEAEEAPTAVDAATVGPLRVRLPHDGRRLFGRERELAQLLNLLDTTRLVTVTGPGGTGKTALAVVAARARVLDGYDGACLVELQGVDEDASELADDVAKALGLPEAVDAEGLIRLIAGSRVLVVLDNCEHVLPAVRHLLQRVMAECPGVTVLATSRIALGLGHEQVLSLRPLDVPAEDDAPGAAECSAVQLFAEHTRLRDLQNVLTEADIPVVVRICRRLDGLPLAIVVAAAQTRRRSISEIERDLDRCLSWQTPHERGRGDQQRTLRAAVEWSHDLLTEPAKDLFRRLSVFAGSFSTEGAQALLPDGADAASALDELVDHSLVAVTIGGAATRYRLLEVVRRYAGALEAASAEWASDRDRHLQHVTDLVTASATGLTSGERVRVVACLEEDRDEFRVALEWAQADPSRASTGQRLAGSLFWYWNSTGRFAEARSWLERAVNWSTEPTRARAEVLYALGAVRFMQGAAGARDSLEQAALLCRGGNRDEDVERLLALILTVLAITRLGQDDDNAVAAARESVDLFGGLSHDWGRALALNDLGRVLFAIGEVDAADAALAQSLDAWRDVGDSWGAALALTTLANIRCERGETDDARQQIERALALQINADDAWGQGNSMFVLGAIAEHEGQLAVARDRYADSVQRNYALGRFAVAAGGLVRLADVAARAGHGSAAAALLAGSTALLEENNAVLPAREHARRDRTAEAVRSAAAVANNHRSSPAELVTLARGLLFEQRPAPAFSARA